MDFPFIHCTTHLFLLSTNWRTCCAILNSVQLKLWFLHDLSSATGALFCRSHWLFYHWMAGTRVIFHKKDLKGAQTLSFTSYISKRPPWQKPMMPLHTYAWTLRILTMLAGNKILVPLVVMYKSCKGPGDSCTHTYTQQPQSHTCTNRGFCISEQALKSQKTCIQNRSTVWF